MQSGRKYLVLPQGRQRSSFWGRWAIAKKFETSEVANMYRRVGGIGVSAWAGILKEKFISR
jgi:hypothetical protein